jgi:hypothetical protein
MNDVAAKRFAQQSHFARKKSLIGGYSVRPPISNRLWAKDIYFPGSSSSLFLRN